MIDRRAIAVILLAAGQSSRFGRPKLSASLAGQPLAHHAASMIAGRGFGWQFAVCGTGTPPLSPFGFTELPLDPPASPLSRSLAIGITAAAATPAEAALVLLADMPLVPFLHIEAMIERFDCHCLASSADGVAMPPALFGRDLFGELQGLSGDRGAAALLRAAPQIELPEGTALDIDTEQDLAQAAAHPRLTRQL